MGLTGIILSVTFSLKPIPSPFVMVETRPTKNLEETMEAFLELHDRAYSVAWVDTLARGKRLGRSLVMAGDFVGPPPGRASLGPGRKVTVPWDAPSFLLGRASVSLFNELYYRKGALGRSKRVRPYDGSFFPWTGLATGTASTGLGVLSSISVSCRERRGGGE